MKSAVLLVTVISISLTACSVELPGTSVISGSKSSPEMIVGLPTFTLTSVLDQKNNLHEVIDGTESIPRTVAPPELVEWSKIRSGNVIVGRNSEPARVAYLAGHREHSPAMRPTPTPIVLTTSGPSDAELLLLISAEHPKVDPLETEKLIREEIDVTGDGRQDILVGGTAFAGRVPFLGIFSQSSSENPWKLIFYCDRPSNYGANVRIDSEESRIVADFLTMGGGTGYLELELWQRWIECGQTECNIVWEYPSLRTWQTAGGPIREISRGYQTTEVKQRSPQTIQLLVNHFSLENAPYDVDDDYLVVGTDRTYWSTGPKLRQTYQQDDDVFAMVDEEQIIQEMQIVRPFSAQTNATTQFLSHVLSKQNDSSDAYKTTWAEFWGLPSPDLPSDPIWGAWHQKVDAAATDGFRNQYHVDDKSTTWVAGVTSAIDRPLCRLTVQEYREERFILSGRVELPCISNFTRLDYADVDGDGDTEVLLLTIAPDSKDPASVQRLYMFSVETGGLRTLATFDGAINGPDLAGVRWEQSPNGFKVFTGLPLVDLSCAVDNWSCVRMERQFATHIWNSDLQRFEDSLAE